jgi:hypothetical protein
MEKDASEARSSSRWSITTDPDKTLPRQELGKEPAMTLKDAFVDYVTFGATGDGVSDDLPAICAAHEHANAHGMW